MPSWPNREASPKRENPNIVLNMAMLVCVSRVIQTGREWWVCEVRVWFLSGLAHERGRLGTEVAVLPKHGQATRRPTGAIEQPRPDLDHSSAFAHTSSLPLLLTPAHHVYR